MAEQLIWKPCIENNRYEVSQSGLVRSTITGNILKQQEDKDGYLRIGFYAGIALSESGNRYEKKKHYRVHRLVYSNHKGPIPDGMEVNHMDRNRKNNNDWNLEILTSKENKDLRVWGPQDPDDFEPL